MLKESVRFILKDTAIYGIAGGLSKFLALLTLPIIVKNISTADFGIWNLLTLIGSIISSVLIFGMDSSVVRYYYDSESLEHKKNVFSQGLFFQLILFLCFAVFGFFIPELFLSFVNVDNSYSNDLLLVFLWIPANILTQYFQNWFKWTFQRIQFLLLSAGLAVLNLSILYYGYRTNFLNLKTVLLINTISCWIFALLGLWWCRNYLRFRIDKILMKKLAIFGFPMMLVMLVGMLSSSLDRLFLAQNLSPENLGIYSLSQKLSIIMLVVVAAFQIAFGPFLFSNWDRPEAKKTIARFQSYYIIVIGIIAIIICSFGKNLVLIIGSEEYLGAEKVLPYLIFGVVLYGLYSFASIGIFYAKKMFINLLALSCGFSINLILNLILSPYFLEYGVAFGFVFGNLVLIAAAYIFSKQYYPVNFSFVKDTLALIFLFFILSFINISIVENIWEDAIIKAFLCLLIFIPISVLLLQKEEKKYITDFLKFNKGE